MTKVRNAVGRARAIGNAKADSKAASPASGKAPGPKGSKAKSVVELQEQLREAGLRSTAPRIAVLSRLVEARTPVSHGELAEELASFGYDRATIYRNLMDLTEAGLVARTDLGDHVWRFELRRDGGSHGSLHPHFVCTDCGNIACLPGSAVRIMNQAGVPRAVGQRSVEVQIKGRCDRCA